MVKYRLYSLDGTGNLEFPEQFAAATDQEAIATAREMKRTALQCEVWEGRRLVAVLRRQDLAA
jgi:hypothetical protein